MGVLLVHLRALCQSAKNTAAVNVIPLLVWEFGKAPRILCRQWQCSNTKLFWGCQYLCHTPACKGDSSLPDNNSWPPNLSWCHQSVESLNSAALSVIPRLEGGRQEDQKIERGVKVTNHYKELRETTESHWECAHYTPRMQHAFLYIFCYSPTD